MKILITGGYGFIGSHIADRLFKEGHELFIIDDLSSGKKENVCIQHKSFVLNTADKQCEEVFRIHNIDAVIHLAAPAHEIITGGNSCMDSQANLLGLVQLLDLSRKYGVKQFIFASSTEVYSPQLSSVCREVDVVKPVSLHGMNQWMGEQYCEKWRDLYGLNTVILRIANVYGPRQHESCVISTFMQQMVCEQDFTVYGDDQQMLHYIYVEDVADAVYRVISQPCDAKLMNIASQQAYGMVDIVEELRKLGNVKSVQYTEQSSDVPYAKVDNTVCRTTLHWQEKYTLSEGLAKTYAWYQGKNTRKKELVGEKSESKFSKVRPYIENFLLFIIMIFFAMANNQWSVVNAKIGLDYNYIYIATMGLLYGKTQSLPATFLSVILLAYTMVIHGSDFVAVFYQAQHIIHFATYLFVGVLTGYVTDSKDRIVDSMQRVVENFTQRYRFLEARYMESIQEKDKLYKQIINSGDSLGRTYHIIQKLDSIEVEKIFTVANQIIAEIMHTEAVAIYTMGKNEAYLRQKTKSGQFLQSLPKSLKISEFDYLKPVMQEGKVFVNKQLRKDYPDMAAPVIYDGKVISVLQIYDLPFDALDLHHETLLKVTAMLISDALGKAYRHERIIQDKKYIENTRILTPEEFIKIQNEMHIRKANGMIENAAILLKIGNLRNADKDSLHMISDALNQVIREEDFLGIKENGNVYILLSDIAESMAKKVQARIAQTGILTERILGGLNE